MKIERISDNQIRFILTRQDLEERSLRLSELAYGSDKARALFRDMMQQAAFQLGFTAENVPLMIEAIPLGNGSIILNVTKVENPEELDTRFSNFAPSVQKNVREPGDSAAQDPLLQAMRETFSPPPPRDEKEEIERYRQFLYTNRLYRFENLSDVIRAANITASSFTGTSTLFRDEKAGCYYLTLQMEDADEAARMQHTLSVLSEYGSTEQVSLARQQHLREHCRVICEGHALQTLTEL